jgi:hypothetical protein
MQYTWNVKGKLRIYLKFCHINGKSGRSESGLVEGKDSNMPVLREISYKEHNLNVLEHR